MMNKRPCFHLFCSLRHQVKSTVRQAHLKYCHSSTDNTTVESGIRSWSRKYGAPNLNYQSTRNLWQVSKTRPWTPYTRLPFSVHGLESPNMNGMSRTWSGVTQRKYSSVTCTLLVKSSQSQPVQFFLDLEKKLSPENHESIRNSLSARGSDLNFDQLLEDYQHLRDIEKVKTRLETERYDIAKTMAFLVKGEISEDNMAEKEELTKRGRIIKEELNELMPVWSEAKINVLEQALKLPTDLHPDVPETVDKPVCVWKSTVGDAEGTSHIQFAAQLGLLKFSNAGPRAVFLRRKLADLEQSLLEYASRCVKRKGFQLLTAPGIFRSMVVEGSGMDPLIDENFFRLEQKEGEQEKNAYYLKGNSLHAYTALLAKMKVRHEHLPLQYYSVGRHYEPKTGPSLPGLYGVVQSGRVSLFAASQHQKVMLKLHQDMEEAMLDIVRGLGLPARKVLVSARNLEASEGLRTEIQLWAPSLHRYVPMAFLCLHNDYASHRLMSSASTGEALHMVSGVAMDTPVVLASILEHSYSRGQFKLLSIPGVNTPFAS